GSCASPTGLSGSSSPSPGAHARWGTFANFAFNAPAGTDIRRVVLWRYATGVLGTDDPNTPDNESGRWEVNAQFDGNSLFADTCHPGEGIWPNPCHTGSPSFSDASRVVHDGRGQAFTVGIFCGGTNGPFIVCSTADGARNPLGALNFQGATVTLGDTSPPKVAVGGPLFSAGWRHPADVATFKTSDNSGIKLARLEAEGKVLQSTAYPCDRTLPVPCRTVMAGQLRPRGITDGVHTVRVVTLDAAGNSGVAQRQVQVDATPPTAELERASGKTVVIAVGDATSGVASAAIEARNRSTEPVRNLAATLAGGKLRAKLDRGSASRVELRVTARDAAGNVTKGNPASLSVTNARFGRRTRRVRSNRVKVPFGRRATLHGRLLLSAGRPFAGQTIGLASTVRRRGAPTRLLRTATTDRRGRFSIRIPAGPSRTLRFAFGGAPGALAIARTISYRVPASSTIRASRTRLFGAGRVLFSGRLRTRGQRIPGRGLVLILQGRERGRWRTFDDTRSNGTGRWHATYNFSGRPGLYPIRVRVPRQTSYPFELGYSRSVVVRVV
ncbi:MAG: hypothetical protein QOC68_4597, partial [Solirubrobacteraceae bacterium]|nr:hypothetical protein [Solirubrobacteraceae bacterium]